LPVIVYGLLGLIAGVLILLGREILFDKVAVPGKS
jgi:hypothetical protein